MEYLKMKVVPQLLHYKNGNLAVRLLDYHDNLPLITLTVNSKEVHTRVIKTVDNNAYNFLLDNGLADKVKGKRKVMRLTDKMFI